MDLLRLITPVNLTVEKEKFLASREYHPQFTYGWNEKEVQELIASKTQYQHLAEGILGQNSSQIVEAGRKIFETEVKPELVAVAKKILDQRLPKLPEQQIAEVEKAFGEAFGLLGIPYQIEVVNESGFNFRPRYKDRKVVVSKYLRTDYFSIDGEVKHELTHVIRELNGKYNGIKKSENYLPTEEGLACYFHDYVGDQGEWSLFQHAAEYAVTEVGLKGSLREMVDFLCDYGFDQELAWQRAARHKFGFRDTRLAGDIMKPSMYFYHEQKIKALKDEERLRLLVGKISIDDLAKYETYEGMIEEEKIREFYRMA